MRLHLAHGLPNNALNLTKRNALSVGALRAISNWSASQVSAVFDGRVNTLVERR